MSKMGPIGLTLLEQRYGRQIRRHQMQTGLSHEIRHLVLRVLREAERALTIYEVNERVRPLLPKDVAKQLEREPYYFGVHDLVEGALVTLSLDEGKVEKKEVYFPLHQHDA